VKFSFRQILASAGGAVIAATIASLFGVKGTIVGVAIGSAAATFGTAVVAQSIERGHQAVKQVVVRVPESAALLRRLGGTVATGVSESAQVSTSVPTEETTSIGAETQHDVAVTEGTPDPVTALQPAVVLPVDQPAIPPGRPHWPVIAGTVAVVFVLSLMFVTAVELIAGKPLANLFGGHSGSGTTVQQIIESPPTTLPPPAPTTTTTSSTSTSSTTSTTLDGGTTTTTNSTGAPSVTTSSGPDGSSSSTTSTTGGN
jgi:hypothetical protein